MHVTFVALVLLYLAGAGYAQTWRNITPTDGPAPMARVNPSAIYDALTHRMIVFGGRSSSGDLDDLWAFDLNTHQWSEIQPASEVLPEKRYTHNALYDPEHHQMLIWSGRHAGTSSVLFNDVWSFDLQSLTWTELIPDGRGPNTRYGTAAVLDLRTRTLVNFAGFTAGGRFDDTWRFAIDDLVWTEISPATGHPGKRCLHAGSYDTRTHRMLIYGGQGSPNGLWDDLWAFDLEANTWTDLTPEERPPGRFFPTHIYDEHNHRALIFGGDVGPELSNKLWAFDLSANAWSQLMPAGELPSPRVGSAGIYVPSEGRMVIFGGSDEGNLNEVWSLDGLGPITTAVEENRVPLPARAALEQNYPNPFNPSTTIHYNLSAPSRVHLAIYDPLGRRIATLENGRRAAGRYTAVWDGTSAGGQAVGAGVYFYRLATEEGVQSRKLVLLK
jgi:hypothetical protein